MVEVLGANQETYIVLHAGAIFFLSLWSVLTKTFELSGKSMRGERIEKSIKKKDRRGDFFLKKKHTKEVL